jgi:hypothetical protein
MNDDILGQGLSAEGQSATEVAVEQARGEQSALQGRPARSKVRELGIFTAGIGIIVGTLCFWAFFILEPPPGKSNSLTVFAFPLSLSVLYIVLGVLNLMVRNRALIGYTICLVVIGFLIEMLIDFNIIKAVISAIIIWLIIKNGGEALAECPRPT